MKDNRFIELVNLYVDRQITAEETAELEAEIQGDPRRRAVYRQYCQMHCATKQVYGTFRGQAASGAPALPVGRPSLTPFQDRPAAFRSSWTFAAGGLVAACLALVVVRVNTVSIPVAAPAVVAVAKAAPAPQLAPTMVAATAPMSGLVSLRNAATGETNYAGWVETLRREDQRALANTPGSAARQVSLFDDGVFDAQPLLLPNAQRAFGAARPAAGQPAEFTAFEFRR